LVIGFIGHLQLGITGNYNAAQITITPTSLLSLLQPPLGVVWLQYFNKGYSSRPCSLRTAPTNRRLRPPTSCRLSLLAHTYSRQSSVTQLDSAKARIRSRYIASGRTPQKTPLPTALLLLRVQLLLRSRDGYRPFASNSRLCWFHNSGFQETCDSMNVFSAFTLSQKIGKCDVNR
jgi:hypothetical protein